MAAIGQVTVAVYVDRPHIKRSAWEEGGGVDSGYNNNVYLVLALEFIEVGFH